MEYPTQIYTSYVNPLGNLAASGDYRSWKTQDLANKMPPWMHLRENPVSIGQQFLSPTAMILGDLEPSLNNLMRSKFLPTARVDEMDIVYRVSAPSNLDLTDSLSKRVTCIANPEGVGPSGIYNLNITETFTAREFYYDAPPTRLELVGEFPYTSSVSGDTWKPYPSGVFDVQGKKVDIWGKAHELTWCYDGASFRKQDAETTEDYEVYVDNGVGVVTGMSYKDGILWSLGATPSGSIIALTSTKTQMPVRDSLDRVVEFDISGVFDTEPSGIISSEDGHLYLCDTNKTRIFDMVPRYDYFILNSKSRHLYFREDYGKSGVLISNT
jgi:hypothetical protein